MLPAIVQFVPHGSALSTTTSYTLTAYAGSASYRTSNLDVHVAKDGSTLASNTMEVYPNPTSGNLFVNYVAQSAGTANIAIVDLSGRLMMRRDLSLVAQPEVENLHHALGRDHDVGRFQVPMRDSLSCADSRASAICFTSLITIFVTPIPSLLVYLDIHNNYFTLQIFILF